MPYIQHRLGQTFYTAKGFKKKKTPLIFLHGGPGGMHDSQSPLFELARERPIYLYTQIGGGKSSAIKPAKMKIETFVWELATLIKAWQLERFHLAGGSWGTTLALEYYLRQKGNGVASLIFQSPMFSAKDWQKDALGLIKKMSKQDQKIIRYCHEINATDAKVYQEVMFRYYLKHLLRNKKKLEEFFNKKNPNGKKVYQTMWGPSEFQASGTLKSYHRVGQLKHIKVPSLIICGQYDEATPKTGRQYQKAIKNAQFAEIAHASHAILKEKPKAMLKVIQSFLKGCEE